MKNLFITLFFVPLFFNAQPRKKPRVLFLGNSYTYVNNLPDLIYNIAIANGDSMIYDGNLIGGYTFNNHFTDATSKAKISVGNWEFVVLQAQSQEPSFAPWQVNYQTFPYAIKLDSLIHHYNTCATTVFYETWGRKNGDASNCAVYPPVCTYLGMQNRLRASYKQFADSVKAVMAPAGEAFRKSIAATPTLDLYQSDQSHPSLEGSYLVAAVFYETLFQKSVLSNTYNPGINAQTLIFLQQTAHTTVRDSLSVWNIDKYLPSADFAYVAPSPGYFSFASQCPSINNTWYFGDGTFSQSGNPTHTYAGNGTYTVSHVVSYKCRKDSTAKKITAAGISTGLTPLSAGLSPVQVYPNPCSEFLFVSIPPACDAMEIRNLLGETVLKPNLSDVKTSQKIDVSSLPAGAYMLLVKASGGKFSARKFVVSR